jgi:hypothetical protein
MGHTFFISEVVQISCDKKRTLVAVRHAEKRYHVHYVLQDWSLARLRTKVLCMSKYDALQALEMVFEEVVSVFSIETKQEKKARQEASVGMSLPVETEA